MGGRRAVEIDPAARKAILQEVARGASEASLVRTLDLPFSITTLRRYQDRHPRFERRMVEAKALAEAGATEAEIADLVAGEPWAEPPPADLFPPLRSIDPRPPAPPRPPGPPPPRYQESSPPALVEVEVVSGPSPDARPIIQPRRPRTNRQRMEAFMDQCEQIFQDPNEHVALRIASQRSLTSLFGHMLKRDALIDLQNVQAGRPVDGASTPTAKGLKAEAAEQIFSQIAGPPPAKCPACHRMFWLDGAGKFRPHFPDVDPRADGWARDAKGQRVEGLCPGEDPGSVQQPDPDAPLDQRDPDDDPNQGGQLPTETNDVAHCGGDGEPRC